MIIHYLARQGCSKMKDASSSSSAVTIVESFQLLQKVLKVHMYHDRVCIGRRSSTDIRRGHGLSQNGSAILAM
jgi:hypothetical protein